MFGGALDTACFNALSKRSGSTRDTGTAPPITPDEVRCMDALEKKKDNLNNGVKVKKGVPEKERPIELS